MKKLLVSGYATLSLIMAGGGLTVVTVTTGCDSEPPPADEDTIEIGFSPVDGIFYVDTVSHWRGAEEAGSPIETYIPCTLALGYLDPGDAGKEVSFSFQYVTPAYNTLKTESLSYTVPSDQLVNIVIYVLPDLDATEHGANAPLGWRFHAGQQATMWSHPGPDSGGVITLWKKIWIELDRLIGTPGNSEPNGYAFYNANSVLEGTCAVGTGCEGDSHENLCCAIDYIAYDEDPDGTVFNPDSTIPVTLVGDGDFLLEVRTEPGGELLWDELKQLAHDDVGVGYRNTGLELSLYYLPVYMISTDYITSFETGSNNYLGWTWVFQVNDDGERYYGAMAIARAKIDAESPGWAIYALYGATVAHELGHYLGGIAHDDPHYSDCIMVPQANYLDHIYLGFCPHCKDVFLRARYRIDNAFPGHSF